MLCSYRLHNGQENNTVVFVYTNVWIEALHHIIFKFFSGWPFSQAVAQLGFMIIYSLIIGLKNDEHY